MMKIPAQLALKFNDINALPMGFMLKLPSGKPLNTVLGVIYKRNRGTATEDRTLVKCERYCESLPRINDKMVALVHDKNSVELIFKDYIDCGLVKTWFFENTTAVDGVSLTHVDDKTLSIKTGVRANNHHLALVLAVLKTKFQNRLKIKLADDYDVLTIIT